VIPFYDLSCQWISQQGIYSRLTGNTILSTGFSFHKLASAGKDILFCYFWFSVGWQELQMCMVFSIGYFSVSENSIVVL
jgi:hypothetical protein